MMLRRKFLALLGGAVTAGPKMVGAAAASMTDLTPQGIAGLGNASALTPTAPAAPADWAAAQLARLKAMLPQAVEREKREFYLAGLEPDIAALRSVRLGTKIRMSRDIAFARYRRNQKTYLDGVVGGLWE